MIRTTTPSVTIVTNTDLSQYPIVNMYFRQDTSNSDLVKKEKANMTIEVNKVTASLSQAETKLFDSDFPLKIQLRIKSSGGATFATKIFNVKVSDVLNDESL